MALEHTVHLLDMSEACITMMRTWKSNKECAELTVKISNTAALRNGGLAKKQWQVSRLLKERVEVEHLLPEA